MEAKVKLIIGDSGEIDLEDEFGIYLVESPNIFTAPFSEYEISSYPEESKTDVDSRSIQKPFDYEVKLALSCGIGEVGNVMSQVRSLLWANGSGNLTILRDYYKGVEISGYPVSISEDEFGRGAKDVFVFNLKFYVNNPKECNFYFSPPVNGNFSSDSNGDYAVSANGNYAFIIK